jgi:cyanophycinase-like exopeptidase
MSEPHEASPLSALVGDAEGVSGWLALLGGGEFSFGETVDADAAWLEHAAPGPIGFVPAASGSQDYARHFATYLAETFQRELEVVPVYRDRDARRGKNALRVAALPAVYLGGGVADHLLDAVAGSPVAEALEQRWREGGVVAAMAAAAQACGAVVRSIAGGELLPGLGWLPGAAIETNFDPGHDRRLRRLLAAPGVRLGLGLPAGSAVLLGPRGAVEVVGAAFLLGGADADLVTLGG